MLKGDVCPGRFLLKFRGNNSDLCSWDQVSILSTLQSKLSIRAVQYVLTILMEDKFSALNLECKKVCVFQASVRVLGSVSELLPEACLPLVVAGQRLEL